MAKIISPENFYDDLVNKLSREIADYSPQIFFDKYNKSNLPPFAECSSILVTIEEQYFLITAGHCIRENAINSIGVMLKNDFCRIAGKVVCFEPNSMNFYEPNNLDVAIYELNNETTLAIKEKYEFLQIHQLAMKSDSSEISKFILFGYPEYKTQKHAPTKTIISKPLIIRTTGVSRKCYIKERIDYGKILMLSADQKNVMLNTSRTYIELPDLNGISGCGIWSVSNIYDKEPRYQLISILTGENFKKTFLYSARIDYIRLLLENAFWN